MPVLRLFANCWWGAWNTHNLLNIHTSFAVATTSLQDPWSDVEDEAERTRQNASARPPATDAGDKDEADSAEVTELEPVTTTANEDTVAPEVSAGDNDAADPAGVTEIEPVTTTAVEDTVAPEVSAGDCDDGASSSSSGDDDNTHEVVTALTPPLVSPSALHSSLSFFSLSSSPHGCSALFSCCPTFLLLRLLSRARSLSFCSSFCFLCLSLHLSSSPFFFVLFALFLFLLSLSFCPFSMFSCLDQHPCHPCCPCCPQVAEILDTDSRLVRGKVTRRYRVRWTTGDVTWEPRANLAKCSELLDQYNLQGLPEVRAILPLAILPLSPSL